MDIFFIFLSPMTSKALTKQSTIDVWTTTNKGNLGVSAEDIVGGMAYKTGEILQTKREIKDEGIFLHYAPTEAKRFFATLSPEHKEHLMHHIEYKRDSISFFDGDKYFLAEIANRDLYPSEMDLTSPGIERKEGTTLFQYDALMTYTKENNIHLPSQKLINMLLQLMPAKDYRPVVWSRAAKQLYKVLWGNEDIHSKGMWTDTPKFLWSAYALQVGDQLGNFDFCMRENFFPARQLLASNISSTPE
jgi:hypothetical protein